MRGSLCSLIILIFFSSSLYGSEEVESGLDFKARQYLRNLKKSSLLKKQRASKSYKRIYAICSDPYEYTQLKYIAFSALQTIQISSSFLTFDFEKIMDLYGAKYYLSPELLLDLDHPAFYLALKDCHYSIEDISFLLMDLIFLDCVGKLMGGIGLYRIFFFLFHRMVIFKKYFPLGFKIFISVSGLSAIYNGINRFYYDRYSEHGDEMIITSLEDLHTIINTKDMAIKSALLKDDHLKDLSHRIELLENKKSEEGLPEEKVVRIQTIIDDLQIKYKAAQLLVF